MNQPRSSVFCGEIAPVAFGRTKRPVAILAALVSGETCGIAAR